MAHGNHPLPELLDALASPDPAVRDGWAYEELADGIAAGRWRDRAPALRAAVRAHLGSEEVQARTFAPLLAGWLMDAGLADESLAEDVAAWYLAEPDTRGWDDRLGWLHAIAHGADLIATAVAHGQIPPGEGLRILARRACTPGPPWIHQEDARMARATLVCLRRCGDAEEATDWILGPEGLDEALRRHEAAALEEAAPGPPPAWPLNVAHLCSSLCSALPIAADAGPRGDGIPWAEETRTALLEVLARIMPWLYRPVDSPSRD